MGRILIFSDLHIGINKLKQGLVNTDKLETDIMKQIFTFCVNRNIKDCLFLGDMFEPKDLIPNKTLMKLTKWLNLFEKQNINIIALMGNHDFADEAYPSLAIFEMAFKNFFLIREPTKFSIQGLPIGFIPYIRNEKEFVNAWNEVGKWDNIDIVCFHRELPGMVYESGYKVEKNYNYVVDLDRLYLTGHIHIPQTIGKNIVCVGAPYQTTFTSSTNRFIYEVNVRQDEYEIITHQLDYPKFKLVTLDKIKEGVNVKDCHICIVCNKSDDLDEISKRLLGAGALSVSRRLTQSKKIFQKKHRMQGKLTDLEILTKFVKQETGSNNEKLVSLGLGFLNG